MTKNKNSLIEKCNKAIMDISKKVKENNIIIKEIDTKANHLIERFRDIYNIYRTGMPYWVGNKNCDKYENGY